MILWLAANTTLEIRDRLGRVEVDYMARLCNPIDRSGAADYVGERECFV